MCYPVVLPADVAAILEQPNKAKVSYEVDVAEPNTPTSIASEPRTRHSTDDECADSNGWDFQSGRGRFRSGEVDDGVSEADKQAFLEALASVRASSQAKYDARTTHWPTLAATAAAAIAASALFSWFTSR